MSHRDRPCSWCAAPVIIEHRAGRPRLYCNQTCRQRAYEHRHGFRHQRTVRPLPGQHHAERRQGSGYELGVTPDPTGKRHALRVAVRPEGIRRETLCGVLAHPRAGRYYFFGRSNDCISCDEAVRAHPLSIGISPSNELSRLRAVIEEGVEGRLDPAAMLEWLHQQGSREHWDMRAGGSAGTL